MQVLAKDILLLIDHYKQPTILNSVTLQINTIFIPLETTSNFLILGLRNRDYILVCNYDRAQLHYKRIYNFKSLLDLSDFQRYFVGTLPHNY